MSHRSFTRPQDLPCITTTQEYHYIYESQQISYWQHLLQFVGPHRKPTPLQNTLGKISERAANGELTKQDALNEALGAIFGK